MENNKIIDLFCGCGGLSLGFEMAGYDPIVAIDFWQDAVSTFNHNHKSIVAQCMDITKIPDTFFSKYRGSVAGVIGGPPCQGFSTVGKRDTNDPRNQLYNHYVRVVKLVEPDFFVLENVNGLVTLDRGSFKEAIIDNFTNLGYTVEWQVLNAADYGVPQNRNRVFFVGMKGRAYHFPTKNSKHIGCKDAISDLVGPDYAPSQSEYQRKMRGACEHPLNHDFTHHTEQTVSIVKMVPDGGSIMDLPRKYWEVRKYNKAFERMKSDKPANTVDCGHRNYFHYEENRIPTVRENARIQSFPDSFEVLGTKGSQYKQIGNAVPPLLSKAIADNIFKMSK